MTTSTRPSQEDEAVPLARTVDVIDAVARGEIVVLVDDESRENEGDLVVAAQHATPEAVNFMITHGRGLVCVSITADRAAALGLTAMVASNADFHATAFTVSVDGAPHRGVTTGISAHERARTIELVLDGEPDDLRSPGHMFPLVARSGGTLERAGHTEASVDLARLAGLRPAAVIVEIVGDDGRMLRRDGLARFARRHGLVMSSIELLREHLRDEAGRR
ncbi:3,4-dihydroxy-2-butanone-4-phosphate synthase [Microbacterium radiodurans]|uniref:3,4-dihydroxy-2-butanone 4-phosphate synthase n=1 Tax=Microbacterium radiodurans TaxID=661398 RepID=A0A5J5IPL5_9MICO|nr:3,4-dihydroxy-2-butanone-4-phosphate synthase [Microbacterium radiodurans]KAA9085307.1 3,4-dihydroxy-2-butanone-4-phosphate synthase [Microbacterium radiodurans]